MERYLTTFKRVIIDPFSLKPGEILIEDIAHALSMMCVNKHLTTFYSRAEFNILCCLEAKSRNKSKKIQMMCLLHRAYETYLPDLDTLVENNISYISDLKNSITRMISRKYIKESISVAEMEVALRIIYDCEDKINNLPSSKPSCLTNSRTNVKNEYLQLFNELLKAKDFAKKDDFISVGIDGCEGRWIVVAISNSKYSIEILRSIEEVCQRYSRADSILIDMPIGLPETAAEAELRPDSGLRKVLKGKASSVFNVPCRQAVYETDKTKMRETNIKVLGKSLSEQSIAIIPKIREIDTYLQKNEQWKNKLRESHPEVCFAILNHGIPILENKKEPEGIEKRIALLEEYYPDTRIVVRKYRALGYSSRNLNDLLDALCLAIVGKLGMDNDLSSIPKHPVVDQKGLIMQVVIPLF